MKKVIFSIIFIIIVFMVILGAFYINKDKKFKATATVIDIISFSKIKVELKENNKIIGNSEINTTIFSDGDILEVEGLKNNNLTIDKIKFLGTTDKDKSKLISNIDKDVKLMEYEDMINIEARSKDSDEGISLINVHTLPVNIQNQEYHLNITPLDSFNIKYKDMDYEYNTVNNSEIIITSQKKFIVKDVSIYYEDKIEKLEYTINNNSLKFDSKGSVIYSVIIEYENGDVLNYIFA